MLSNLKPVIYVQISPDRLCVRNVKTGKSISDIPEIAIACGPKPGILGVGQAARMHASNPLAKVINPFGHPRTLVSDFTSGEQLIREFVRRVQGHRWFSLAPVILMHPVGDPSGGFTQIELRALREMAVGAGASEVFLYQGRSLSDPEILSGQFDRDDTDSG